jgi:hypothetical protein
VLYCERRGEERRGEERRGEERRGEERRGEERTASYSIYQQVDFVKHWLRDKSGILQIVSVFFRSTLSLILFAR